VRGVSDQKKWGFSARWIPEKSKAGQLFFSAKYWVNPDLGVGIDYRPLVDVVRPTVTYRFLPEDPHDWKPALIVGSGVDDFSDGRQSVESRSYFFTLSKALPEFEFLGVTPAPYVGAVWIDELDVLRTLVGVNFRHEKNSLMIQYSGTDTHLTLSHQLSDRISVSGIYWGMKYPGLGLQMKF